MGEGMGEGATSTLRCEPARTVPQPASCSQPAPQPHCPRPTASTSRWPPSPLTGSSSARQRRSNAGTCCTRWAARAAPASLPSPVAPSLGTWRRADGFCPHFHKAWQVTAVAGAALQQEGPITGGEPVSCSIDRTASQSANQPTNRINQPMRRWCTSCPRAAARNSTFTATCCPPAAAPLVGVWASSMAGRERGWCRRLLR